MKRAFSRFRAAAAFVAALVLSSAQAGAAPTLNDDERVALTQVSQWLNSIKTMSGEFTQVSSDGGTSEGTFYLKKPGRLRFEYLPPTPLLVVADGYVIAVEDTKLETQDRYPLVESPLSVLLNDDVDLSTNENITKVESRPGELRITARADEEELRGTITFVFSMPEISLRYWVVSDPQGVEVTVILAGVKSGVTLSDSLFEIRDPGEGGPER
ncbi:MAG TPA: outer membrane lipoprotein carrier protein LolA [Micropepsaceae bacterium]|nr:outer membrane lipoprotein carrier protein LolA [Micropepsaceae bacterium]